MNMTVAYWDSESVELRFECEQFVDRMLLLLMPIKYQPDYIYLRHVQTSRVHYFTLIQITCSAAMWAVKSVKTTSIAFPLMVLFLLTENRTTNNDSFSVLWCLHQCLSNNDMNISCHILLTAYYKRLEGFATEKELIFFFINRLQERGHWGWYDILVARNYR